MYVCSSQAGVQTNTQVILFRAMVQALLASRSTLYAEPALQPWSPNGGSKINVKIQQLLKRFEGTVPGAAEVVKEEVAALSAKRNTPTKPKSLATRKVKKRKVVKSEDDESQVEFSEES
jgi:hypothetical protein